ncbi:hypothetical protein G6514_001983, partial [Epicoccum nigrum]
ASTSSRCNSATAGEEDHRAAEEKFGPSNPMASLDEDEVVERDYVGVQQQSIRSREQHYRRGPTRRRSERYSMRSCLFPDERL